MPRTRQQSCLILHNWNLTFRHEPHHKMNISQIANRSWTRWDYLSGEKKTQHNVFVAFRYLEGCYGKDVTSGVGSVGRSYSSTDFATSSPVFTRTGKYSSPLPTQPLLLMFCLLFPPDSWWVLFSLMIYYCKFYFWFCFFSGHGMQDLSFLTRDQICAPCHVNAES